MVNPKVSKIMDTTNINDESGYLFINKVGANTPNFAELVLQGLYIPPLPYTFTIDKGDKCVAKRGMARYNGYSRPVDYGPPFGVVPPKTWSDFYPDLYSDGLSKGVNSYFNPFSQPLVTDAVNKYNNKLLAKLKGQSLPVLMALRERKETGRLITSFLEKTVSAIKVIRHPRQVFKIYRGRNPRASEVRRLEKLHKRLLKRARRGAVKASDAWLQYRFVWMTSYTDIIDATRGLATAMERAKNEFVRKGIRKTVSGKAYGGPHLGFTWGDEPMYQFDWDVTIVGHTKIFYRIDDATAALWSQFQDPVSVAWDVIPYSFVIDGVVNISQYLELSQATFGLLFDSGYCSLKFLGVTKTTPRELTSFDWTSGEAARHRYSTYPQARYQLSFSRSILTDFPSQTLEFPMSEYLSLTHIQDLAALAVQYGNRKF